MSKRKFGEGEGEQFAISQVIPGMLVRRRPRSTAGRDTLRKIRKAIAPPASRGFFGSAGRFRRMQIGMPELKVLDTAAAAYVCDTTGSVTLLNGITQGSDFTNRIGRRFVMKTVQLNGILNPVDAGTLSVLCRVLIVYDSQTNGVIGTVAGILSAASSLSFMNLDNRSRFRVVMDKMISLGPTDTGTAGSMYTGAPTVGKIQFFKKVNLPTVCDGTTNGIGDINTGALYLVTIGNQAAGTGGQLNAAVRIRFTDA